MSQEINYDALANGKDQVLRDLAIIVMSEQTGSRWMMSAAEVAIKEILHTRALVERAMDRLADVPGNTLDERLTKFISYYMGLQVMVEDLKAADRDHLAAKRGMETRLTAEIERLRAFVRQVANCEQSDNQNIRRAREIMAQLSSTDHGVAK